MADLDEVTGPQMIQKPENTVRHLSDATASSLDRGVAELRQIRGDHIVQIPELRDLRLSLRQSVELAVDQHQSRAVAGAPVRKHSFSHQRICSGSHNATSGRPIRIAISKTIAPMNGRHPMITSPMVT